MNNVTNSAEDLKTIRKIMEESSRFLSLSGLSGIFAGCYAIAGALAAWFYILGTGITFFDKNISDLALKDNSFLKLGLLTDALVVLILSIATSLILSVRKAKKNGIVIWSPVSRRLLINLMIPLISGGLFTIILFIRNDFGMIVPGLLIFYGLALVNAGKFTYGEVFYLGLLEIMTGLLAAIFSDHGIWFWVLGFGILHIVYGFVMYRKYEA